MKSHQYEAAGLYFFSLNCIQLLYPTFTQRWHISLGDSEPSNDLSIWDNSGHLFFRTLPYGYFEETKLDFFKPNSNDPTPLYLYIHGGGFTGGDKVFWAGSNGEDVRNMINNLLDLDIAVATINYRLLDKDESGELADTLGIGKCMFDAKHALQFLRYHADDFNIDNKQNCCWWKFCRRSHKHVVGI